MNQSIKARSLKIGRYLRYVRHKRGYSIRKLQARSGVDNAYISQLENSRNYSLPKISIINKLAKGLRISPAYMYKMVGVKSVPKFKSNTVDLRRLINNSVRITWGDHRLNQDDLTMIKLWFKHHE